MRTACIRLSFALALASLAAASAVAVGQDPQRPVFRSGVDLVAVDVVVIDGNGRPVPNLTADDFAIEVGGDARRVVSAEYIPTVSARYADVSRPAAAPPADVPAPESNVEQAVGRLILIVADVAHIGAGGGREIMDTAGRFLDTLSPDDRVAVVTIPMGGPRIDFTTDRDRVRDQLALIIGREGLLAREFGVGVSEAIAIVRGDRRAWDDAWQRECEFTRYSLQVCIERLLREVRDIVREETLSTRQSLEELAGLARAIGGIEGPKTLLLLTEGLIQTNETRTYFTDFARTAAAGRVNLYTISIYSPVIDAQRRMRTQAASQDMDLKMNSLEELTGMARGALFRMSGAGAGIFDRIAAELSGYYLLSFEPEGKDRDGKAHRIKVTTRRDGVELRARAEFIAADTTAGVDAPRDPRADLTRLLRDPRIVADVPLRMAAYTVRNDDPSKVKVIVATEIGGVGLDAIDADVGFEVATGDGRIVADSADHVSLTPADSLTPPMHLTAALVDPGAYRLKFAAVDANGRRGSVELTLDARLTSAGPLQLSDLMLGRTDGGGFQPSISGMDTRRDIAGFIEIYGTPPPAPLTARLEIAEDLRAPALATADMAVGLSDDPTRQLATGSVTAAALPPGDYIVRAIVLAGGRELGRASRRLTRR